nr:hypothetical protein [uncultured Flavobacterium sp.]
MTKLLLGLICGISGWLLIAQPTFLIGILVSNKAYKLIRNQNATH